MAIGTHQFAKWKQERRFISVLTAWDYISGQIADAAGVDIVLVGDSLAMVALGYETTLPLTLEEMLHHARAVRRGAQRAMVIVDLPFMTYQISREEALRSAGRVIKETGAHGVKLEGGNPQNLETIRNLVQIGIPVMGHVGMTPQSVNQYGGFRKQGKTPAEADRILAEAKAIQEAGAFTLVLEHIPGNLAQTISQTLTIPTIGIGAGPNCDGQVLVMADVLGLSSWQPPFAKVYAHLRQAAVQATQQFCEEVRGGIYPGE